MIQKQSITLKNMIRLPLLTGIISAVMVFGLTACKGSSQKATYQQEEKTEQLDYATIVKNELLSTDEFLNIVDGFQQGTEKMLPTGNVWDNCEKEISKILKGKGFTVERNKEMNFFIFATRNCKFNIKEDNYIYSFSITPNNSDSLSAAYFFQPMGDMYVKGEILLSDTCVYDAIVDQIKKVGYKPVNDQMGDVEESTKEEKYQKENPKMEKECYFFLCNREEKSISLHYDFMKAQEIRMSN